MSATIEPASAFYAIGEVLGGLYKNQNNNRVHMKADRKVVGTPVNYARRNSNSNSTSANSLNSKLINSNSALISYNDSSINASNNRENRRLDRSLSEPTDRSNNQHKNNQANSSRYKTELCRPYEENGTCKYGDKCQFAHGGHELRNLARHPKYKTELCRTYHTIGFCPYGPRCHFIHNADDNKIQSHPVSRENTPRPKALSTGNFSLGSGADSPPSSVCNSPTSLSPTFFSEDPFSGFANMSTLVTPIANNAFTFSQDFPSLMDPLKVQTHQAYNMNRVHQYNMLNQRNLNEGGECIFWESIIVPDAPPSPIDSLSDLNDNNPYMNGLTYSPLDASRLPIFSRLSTSED